MNQRAINALALHGLMQSELDGQRLARALANLPPAQRREIERTCDEAGPTAGLERLRAAAAEVR